MSSRQSRDLARTEAQLSTKSQMKLLCSLFLDVADGCRSLTSVSFLVQSLSKI